jgi:hypothetical protein
MSAFSVFGYRFPLGCRPHCSLSLLAISYFRRTNLQLLGFDSFECQNATINFWGGGLVRSSMGDVYYFASSHAAAIDSGADGLSAGVLCFA